MKVKKKSALPPRPTLNLATLEQRSNSFAKIEGIVSEQLAKSTHSDELALYMRKAGIDDVATTRGDAYIWLGWRHGRSYSPGVWESALRRHERMPARP